MFHEHKQTHTKIVPSILVRSDVSCPFPFFFVLIDEHMIRSYVLCPFPLIDEHMFGPHVLCSFPFLLATYVNTY